MGRGQHRRRRVAFLERQRVSERLERRSRLPRRDHTIDGAAETVVAASGRLGPDVALEALIRSSLAELANKEQRA